MPLAGRSADVKITSQVATSSTDNAATRSTGVAGTGYVQINDVARRHWDPDTTPLLFLNSTVVSSTNFTVNYVQGKFQWRTGDPSTGTYTIDAEYLTATSVAGGREWQLNAEQDMFEVSTFGSGGWKQYQPNLTGATVSIGRYWTDPSFFDVMALDDAKLLVELIPNSAGSTSARYEGFARVAADQAAAAVDSIVGETINLVIDGQLHYTT